MYLFYGLQLPKHKFKTKNKFTLQKYMINNYLPVRYDLKRTIINDCRFE